MKTHPARKTETWDKPGKKPPRPHPQTTARANEPEPSAADLASTTLRYLTPEMCLIHLGTHGQLHVTVHGERIYGGVFAAYAFPVAHDNEFISLIHTGGTDDEREIGIIRDLNDFPPDQAELVREALTRRYFIHTIRRVHRVGWKYGFVNLDVETDKGRVEFLMRWKHSRAVDYGRRGKVLIDVYNNHFLIPDLDELPAKEQASFRRIIYW